MHVVCAWIGNSAAIAQEHYLQVTEEHYKKAAQKTAQSGAELKELTRTLYSPHRSRKAGKSRPIRSGRFCTEFQYAP
jgi:hypothetical protein